MIYSRQNRIECKTPEQNRNIIELNRIEYNLIEHSGIEQKRIDRTAQNIRE
jgi:hypothetical protein